MPGIKPVLIELTDFKTKEKVDELEVDAVMVATGRAPFTQVSSRSPTTFHHLLKACLYSAASFPLGSLSKDRSLYTQCGDIALQLLWWLSLSFTLKKGLRLFRGCYWPLSARLCYKWLLPCKLGQPGMGILSCSESLLCSVGGDWPQRSLCFRERDASGSLTASHMSWSCSRLSSRLMPCRDSTWRL